MPRTQRLAILSALNKAEWPIFPCGSCPCPELDFYLNHNGEVKALQILGISQAQDHEPVEHHPGTNVLVLGFQHENHQSQDVDMELLKDCHHLVLIRRPNEKELEKWATDSLLVVEPLHVQKCKTDLYTQIVNKDYAEPYSPLI
ncbi:MAG: hypothetical protein WCP93_00950 [Candidatus Berkelbacteria bacterium]